MMSSCLKSRAMPPEDPHSGGGNKENDEHRGCWWGVDECLWRLELEGHGNWHWNGSWQQERSEKFVNWNLIGWWQNRKWICMWIIRWLESEVLREVKEQDMETVLLIDLKFNYSMWRSGARVEPYLVFSDGRNSLLWDVTFSIMMLTYYRWTLYWMKFNNNKKIANFQWVTAVWESEPPVKKKINIH